MRNWLPNPIGGLFWFGVDDANTAVFVPMYCGITETPECFRVGNGDLLTFTWTSAFWIHNWVANMGYGKYDFMIKDIRPVQDSLETKFNKEVLSIDLKAKELYEKDTLAALKMLTEYSCNQAQQTTQRWKKLGEYLMVKYMGRQCQERKKRSVPTQRLGHSPNTRINPDTTSAITAALPRKPADKLKVTKTIYDKN